MSVNQFKLKTLLEKHNEMPAVEEKPKKKVVKKVKKKK